MTPAQLPAPNALIPGSYESNPPVHQRADPARPVTDAVPYVVAAPPRPTTRLGFASAILGDLALCAALIYAAPIAGLVLEGVRTAARLVYGLVWK